MPLPPSTAARKRAHTRRITLEGWKREDGLWDIEGRLTDVKDHDYSLGAVMRPTGEAFHDMSVRVAIDKDFNILAAIVCSDAVPYPGGCESIAPAYQQIVGLNLMHNFRRRVGEIFGSVKGCSHLTELLVVLPPTAFQTFASDMTETEGREPGGKPFPLDKCHALETTTATVKRYYPLWYRGQKTD